MFVLFLINVWMGSMKFNFYDKVLCLVFGIIMYFFFIIFDNNFLLGYLVSFFLDN